MPPNRATNLSGTSDHPSSAPSTSNPMRMEPCVLTHTMHRGGRHHSQRGLARAFVSTNNSSGNQTSEKSSPRSPAKTPEMPMPSTRTMAATRPPLAPRLRAYAAVVTRQSEPRMMAYIA